ncbi:putative decaprenylphosphoryl-5-phosphoribose phosphatase [Longimycelium tulufanense]|uniref:Putative decaprenylphosphoryl-5-phosphoribose phosphatase n=1 Tax=Longimycelium tulufanense TaxID=907463 RepID=A0A8J3CBA3_9PSEU|nr:phosphatase PAP2 family protein [Longimycelium tulufanense]GGM68962.1 putative decaprenylphosphoryl-5-phosphoribose phosphatase [Longimycelium tulufanense]
MITRREVTLLRVIQRGLLGSPTAVRSARALSFFGEHAAGWLVVTVAAGVVDRSRRRSWLLRAAGIAVAHGLSITVKRVVRRNRPTDPRVRALASTPSRLSFPSSHAASTAAAAVLLTGHGRRLATAIVPPMLLSRLVLGVHYPSDVVAGTVLGAAVGLGFRRMADRVRTENGGRA